MSTTPVQVREGSAGFTDGQPFFATEADTKKRWGLCGDGFRCGLCGYRFQVGDRVRWQYLNDESGHFGNLKVCADCDGTKQEILAKARALVAEYNALKAGRMWRLIGDE